jgi:hypothetical protein
VRDGKTTGVPKGINELSRRVLENTRDLVGDLLGAKNAGVTVSDKQNMQKQKVKINLRKLGLDKLD